jgi:hypothetical protein
MLKVWSGLGIIQQNNVTVSLKLKLIDSLAKLMKE